MESISIFLLVVLSIIGTLSHRYEDNLIQRISMALIAFGGCAYLFCQWDGLPAYNPRALLTAGCALFGIGSALKTWRYSRNCDDSR